MSGVALCCPAPLFCRLPLAQHSHTGVDWARAKQHNDIVQLLSPPSPVRASRLDRVNTIRTMAHAGGGDVAGHTATPTPSTAPSVFVPPHASHVPGAMSAPHLDVVGPGGYSAGHGPTPSENLPYVRDLIRSSFAVGQVMHHTLPAGIGGGLLSPASGTSLWDKLQAPLGSPAAVVTASAARHVEGWMAKQSSIVKTWNTRWFVLQGRQISYFSNQVRARETANTAVTFRTASTPGRRRPVVMPRWRVMCR